MSNVTPITNSSINCVENNCSPKYCSMNNSFNECRAICEKIGSEEPCGDTYGCYWNSDASQCQKIDPHYCTTQNAYRSHKNCRKDQNDFCYFSNGECKVCNTGMTNGTYEKLISMDGTQCYESSLGCAPYYKQGNHAACRKYCEFTQQANNDTYTCELCSDVSAQSAINGKCVNYTQCEDAINGYHGAYQQPRSGFFRFLGMSDVLRKSCTLNQYNTTSARRILALENDQFVQLDHFRNITKETDKYVTLMANCSENFIPLYYQYLASGESGASLTADMDTSVVSPNRLISRVCSCPPGYKLETDAQNSKTICTKCPNGQVSTGYDSTECTQKCDQFRQNNNTCVSSCEAWQGFSTRKQTSEKYCFNCTVGSYGTDSGKCIQCPASYYRDSASQTCQRCANNKTTFDSGSFSADQCSVICKNKISASGWCVDQCTQGTYPSSNGNYCEACPAGKQVPANVTGQSSSDCQDCPTGTYKTQFDSKCIPCPGRNTTSGPGATHEGNCSVKCDNVVGIDGTCKNQCEGNQLTVNNRCLDCQLGQVASADGSSCVDFCPAGQAPSPNKICKKCDLGYYQPTPNTTAPTPDLHSQYCLPCPTGKVSSLDRSYCHFCSAYHYIKHGICVKCPEGQYAKSDFSGCVAQCPDYQAPNKYGTCTACKPGQYFTEERTCANCPRRTFSPNGEKCLDCPDGYAAKAGSSECTKCTGDKPFVNNIGTSCVATCNNGQGGNTTTGNCEDCKPGFASNDDNSACVPCTGNQYTDKPAQKTCKTCPDNTQPIQDENGNNIGCRTGCEAGQYLDANGNCQQCPVGQISANTTCYACDGMTVTDATQSSCIACPAGQYPNKNHSECVACADLIQENRNGTFSCVKSCDNEYILTNSTICTPCPAGQFSIDKKKCLTCTQNKYYSETIKRCVQCPPGSYSQRGDVTCTQCVKYLAESGDRCVAACEEGYFVNDNRQCQKCPLGSITLTQNAKYCVSCPSMSFADPDGHECVPCPAGAYSAVGATQCIQCPAYVNSTSNGCTPHCAKGETVDDQNKRCIVADVPVDNNNSTNQTQQDDDSDNHKNKSGNSNNTTILAITIPIILLLLVALIIVTIFMVLKRKNKQNTLQQAQTGPGIKFGEHNAMSNI